MSSKSVKMTMTVMLITLIAVFAVSAQEGGGDVVNTAASDTVSGGVGGFDIDKVYDDAVAPDTSPLFSQAGALGLTRQPENYAIVIMRIIGYLAVVTIFIVLLAWGVRKFGVAGVSRVGGGNNMDIIETIYFGQNRGAALVRVGDTVYLLGHTPENVVLLEKIEGDKAVEMIASAQSGGGIVNFKDAFNNFMGKMKK